MNKNTQEWFDKNIIESVYLETSSIIPLLYNTPYTSAVISVINDIVSKKNKCNFYIVNNCIRETMRFFCYEHSSSNRVQDDIIFRLERIRDNIQKNHLINDADLYTALIGGNIRHQNFKNKHRFMALYYSSFIQNVLEDNDGQVRLNSFISLISEHMQSRHNMLSDLSDTLCCSHNPIIVNGTKRLSINFIEKIQGWGSYYGSETDTGNINVEILPDNMDMFLTSIPDPADAIKEESFFSQNNIQNDKYHFVCSYKHFEQNNKKKSVMIVADSGFIGHCNRPLHMINGNCYPVSYPEDITYNSQGKHHLPFGINYVKAHNNDFRIIDLSPVNLFN